MFALFCRTSNIDAKWEPFELILVPFGALFGGLGALVGPFGRPLGKKLALLGCFGYLFGSPGPLLMVQVV